MSKKPNADFDAVLAAAPKAVKPALTRIRTLVHEVAADIAATGGVVETLKWGQMSFLPARPRVGTTVRMGVASADPPLLALYFHCQTTLVETFREIYADAFGFEGNRALLVDLSKPFPDSELRHCIAMALSYHATKRAANKAASR